MDLVGILLDLVSGLLDLRKRPDDLFTVIVCGILVFSLIIGIYLIVTV
jgi:hypothetical protein